MLGPGIFLAVALAFIHGFASKLNIPTIIPHHRWISFAGGVSISYVFLEIFPELSHAQSELEEVQVPLVAYLENHVYILALLGVIVFYGLDILALHSRGQNQAISDIDTASPTVFWIHITAFALVNAIFGYLLQDLENHSLIDCVLFFLVVALHFFIMDYSLREHHQKTYDKKGRWLLTGAILVGAGLGQATHLHESAIAIVWSFLAGNIILNVLKRELPEEQKSCFWSFLGGAILYTVMLLIN